MGCLAPLRLCRRVCARAFIIRAARATWRFPWSRPFFLALVDLPSLRLPRWPHWSEALQPAVRRRCALCGARITIQSSQRKKNGTVYRYGRYRCSFHVTKGPAVCPNGMSIQQPVLDAKLLAKFQAALSPHMIDYLVGATNERLRQLHGTTPQEIHTLTQERREGERPLSNP